MSFASRDLATVTDLLRSVGRREIMPRFRTLVPSQVRTKSGPLDLVTDADEAGEAALTGGLRRAFPGCLVIGEEAAARDPTGWANGLGEAELGFILDPVDGTANFAAGLPLFGVMAAVVRRGEIVGAAIHDPVRDDTALAVRGEGAWIEDAGGRRTSLRVAAAGPAERMTGCVSWRYLPDASKATVVGNLPRVAAAWDFRCAAHQYRMAAAGHCHFLMYYRLMPWDHAAGWLLHREAGGYAARLDGSAYRVTHTGGGLLCAPDRASWNDLHATLLEGRDEGQARSRERLP